MFFGALGGEEWLEGKVSSSRDTGEIEVAYAEICGMAALDGLDATERKKIERFVEKKIEDVLERDGSARSRWWLLKLEKRTRSSKVKEDEERCFKKTTRARMGGLRKSIRIKLRRWTIVGFILLLGAVAGFLAMLTMPFPTDSLLFPKTKGD